MPSVNQDSELDPHFWRSLGGVASSEEFQRYLNGEMPEDDVDESGVSRRRFLQLMGASITLAGLASCRWEAEEILVENQRPVGTKPGEARHFATAMEHAGVSQPLLVTSIDGRPVKIEGHPDHPASQGAASLYAQASMLGLCDPDRSKAVMAASAAEKVEQKTWAQFSEAIFPVIRSQRDKRGRGIAVVAGASASPTWLRLKTRFVSEFPEAQWVDYEPASRENETAGAKLAFGRPVRSQFNLRNAKRLLLLESDLLTQHPDSLRLARDFAAARVPKKVGDKGHEHYELSRLYVAESTLSTTGSKADHRIPLAPSKAFAFLQAISDAVRTKAAGGSIAVAGPLAKEITAIAEDLLEHRGSSLVVVGPTLPPEVHALAHRLNAELGAAGRTVTFTDEPISATAAEGLAKVARALSQDQVELLLVLGANPAYDAPADARFAESMAKAKTSVHAGLYRDETGQRAGWHLPMSHFLEAWGDGRTFDGNITISQPLIAPLYQTRSAIEVLHTILGEDEPKGLDLVKETHGLADAAWRKAVHDGFVPGTSFAGVTTGLVGSAPAAPRSGRALDAAHDAAHFELVIRPSDAVYDGRFANNGWLQEVPDFITKLTWDNALMMSVKDCDRLGIEMGDWVEVRNGPVALRVPAYPLAGQAYGTLSLALGYGRTAGGVVAGSLDTELDSRVSPVGFSASALRLSENPFHAGGVTLKKVGGTYELAMAQEHHLIDEIGKKGQEERVPNLIRAADLKAFDKKPDFAKYVLDPKENEPLVLESQWEEHQYVGMKWGMSIDLNKCVGCNACIVACQSENNIPVVGKDQVLKGREMHWMRIDRYLIGDTDNPRVDPQPVNCMQCELAPCEQVCPVAATVHNEQGLNDMVYNRCVGTRYCANNCPYKVRRFNYLNYQLKMDGSEDLRKKNESLKLAHNPEVSVRSRGVMEKCTYCTQRISAARSKARIESRALADGDILTACQQTCPADAIVFGDLNLAGSRVAAAHEDPRAYAMLAELNVKPRTLYLAVVRNPNPALS